MLRRTVCSFCPQLPVNKITPAKSLRELPALKSFFMKVRTCPVFYISFCLSFSVGCREEYDINL